MSNRSGLLLAKADFNLHKKLNSIEFQKNYLKVSSFDLKNKGDSVISLIHPKINDLDKTKNVSQYAHLSELKVLSDIFKKNLKQKYTKQRQDKKTDELYYNIKRKENSFEGSKNNKECELISDMFFTT
ncbi:MAG: hypothetical protein MJ252_30475, partial [archaeon]|nr:hypothetical protein [archaeon]